jgi:hypothetical protein
VFSSACRPPLPVITDEQMSKSTIFMPCNYSGHYDPAVAAKFGIVDFVRSQPASPLLVVCELNGGLP